MDRITRRHCQPIAGSAAFPALPRTSALQQLLDDSIGQQQCREGLASNMAPAKFDAPYADADWPALRLFLKGWQPMAPRDAACGCSNLAFGRPCLLRCHDALGRPVVAWRFQSPTAGTGALRDLSATRQ